VDSAAAERRCLMLVRVESAPDEFVHLNPDLITSICAVPGSHCADGPSTVVTLGCDQWIIPGTVEEVLKKLAFST